MHPSAISPDSVLRDALPEPPKNLESEVMTLRHLTSTRPLRKKRKNKQERHGIGKARLHRR